MTLVSWVFSGSGGPDGPRVLGSYGNAGALRACGCFRGVPGLGQPKFLKRFAGAGRPENIRRWSAAGPRVFQGPRTPAPSSSHVVRHEVTPHLGSAEIDGLMLDVLPPHPSRSFQPPNTLIRMRPRGRRPKIPLPSRALSAADPLAPVRRLPLRNTCKVLARAQLEFLAAFTGLSSRLRPGRHPSSTRSTSDAVYSGWVLYFGRCAGGRHAPGLSRAGRLGPSTRFTE